MEKEFVNYEIALILKEKGFMEECFGFYYYDGSFEKYRLVYEESSNDYLNSINAPLWQQVIDWLREKHDLHIEIGGDNYDFIDKFDCYRYMILKTKFQPTDKLLMEDYCKIYTYSYFKARQVAIEHALTLI